MNTKSLLSLFFTALLLISVIPSIVAASDSDFIIENGVLVEYTGDGGMFTDYNGISEVIIPDGVTAIGDSAFFGCRNITNVIIPDSVTSIGERSFYDCVKFSHIIIPDSVTTIDEHAFDLSYNEEAFYSITVPDSVTSIGKNAFHYKARIHYNEGSYYDTHHTEVDFGGDSWRKYTKEGFVIDAYSFNLEWNNYEPIVDYVGNGGDIVIPEKITGISKEAFADCSTITSITITRDEFFVIKENAFKNCTNLKEITISSNYCDIDNNAFEGCTNLRRVTFSDNMGSIADNAFLDCSNLSKVIVPAYIESISSNAFKGCYDLVIHCRDDSSVKTYAVDNGIDYEIIPTIDTNTENTNSDGNGNNNSNALLWILVGIFTVSIPVISYVVLKKHFTKQ